MTPNRENLLGWLRERAQFDSSGIYSAAADEIEWLRATLSMDAPWPLPDVLAELIKAVEHLLEVHSCDTHGHESYRVAIECGKAALTNLRNGLATKGEPV